MYIMEEYVLELSLPKFEHFTLERLTVACLYCFGEERSIEIVLT